MKLHLEFQYFEDCPNHRIMENNLKEAIKDLLDKIDLKKIAVEDIETAQKVKFRGSPTLLINGEDLLGMPAPENPVLACRFYPEGIPSSEKIKTEIINRLIKNQKHD